MLLPAEIQFQGNSWISVVIAVIIAIFGGGGFVALLHFRSEGQKIVVEAAQGAVVVQSGVIEDLRQQIDDLRQQLDQSARLQSRVRELEHREEQLTAENTRLKSEIRDLRQRIAHLEQQ